MRVDQEAARPVTDRFLAMGLRFLPRDCRAEVKQVFAAVRKETGANDIAVFLWLVRAQKADILAERR